MINSVKIGNFKAFGETQEIPIKPLTLLFGKNSSGKSSLIHNLLFLKKYFEDRNLNIISIQKNDHTIDLGGIKQFIHNSNLENDLEFGFEFEKSTLIENKNILAQINQDDSVKFNYRYKFEAVIDIKLVDQPQIKYLKLSGRQIPSSEKEKSYDRILLKFVPQKGSTKRLQLTSILPFEDPAWLCLLDEQDIKLLIYNEVSFHVDRLRKEDYQMMANNLEINVLQEEELSKEFPQSSNVLNMLWYGYFTSLLKPIRNWLIDNCKFSYLPPIRRIPKRNITSSDFNIEKYWHEIIENYNERKIINTFLTHPTLLGLPYKLVVEDYQSSSRNNKIKVLRLKDTRNDNLLSFKDVGTGISQVLPILAMIVAMKNEIILIEQPELHVHPALQSKLGKILSRIPKTSNRAIIETHSEHIIKAIQLEVAKFKSTNGKEGLDRSNLAILYFSNENGRSIVREIELDDVGNFNEPWPDDFFDSSTDLTMERLKLFGKSKN